MKHNPEKYVFDIIEACDSITIHTEGIRTDKDK